MMPHLEHIHEALAELYPGIVFTDYMWIQDPDTNTPVMREWPEDRFGPLNWPALEAKCAEIARREMQARVIAERTRRLALGFDYDFGDARGVHRIGTTKQDLDGWDEVTKNSNAAINLGMPDTVIMIITDTGPCNVTAMEWQNILLAAAAFRQPIWHASFVLQNMDPIPEDYEDDKWWP